MPPQRDPISIRIARLNNLILGRGSCVIQKTNRRSIGITCPGVVEAVSRESLLDAFCLLYNECDKEIIKKRDRNISEFVNKYRPIVEETRQLRVNPGDFTVKTLIGKGYFGNVHLVVELQTGDVYAMKKIKKSVVTTSQVKEERDIMARRSSEWITNLQYAFQDNDHLYLIMEFLPGGDLLSLMSRHGPFDEDLARFYLAELTMALHSLHSMGYVHRDIKPENILIDRFGHMKLADFGNAAALDRDGHVLSLSPVGTPDYIAPELLQTISTYKLSKSMHDVSCDFWSMGIIGYELICEITPFHEDNVHETYSKILSHCEESHLKELITFPSDLKVSTNFRNLIESLVTNPTNRLGYEQIKQHPFFDVIKWSSLRSQVPPIIPTVKSDDDASNFEDIGRLKGRKNTFAKKSITSNMKSAEFCGKDLPFIGYSFVHTEKPTSNTEETKEDEVHIGKMNAKIKDLQGKLKERIDEIAQLKQTLLRAEQTAKHSDSKSKVLQDAKDEIKKMQNIIKEKTMELAACKTQMKTLQSSMKIEEEMWQSKKDAITDLLRMNRQKYEEAKIASDQRYEKLIAEKKNELTSIIQKLDARESELSDKTDECKHLHDKMENYKEMLRQIKEQVEKDHVNFEQNKCQITTTYEQKLSELRSKLCVEKDTKARLAMELRDVRTELNESISSTKVTQEARQATEKNSEEILKRLNNEIETNNKLHLTNTELEQKLSESEKIRQDMHKKINRLEREIQLAECSRQLTESGLASPYETAPGSLTELRAIEDQLRADLEVAKDNETVQKVRADKLEEIVAKLEEMLERFNEQSVSPAKSKHSVMRSVESHAVGDMLERQNEKLEDKLAAVREQMIVERQSARTANLALWKVEKKLEEIEGEKKMVERRMQLTEERIKKMQNERDDALRLLKGAKEEMQQYDERVKELKQELSNCKQDVLKEHRMWEKSEQERMKSKSEVIEHIAHVHKIEESLRELRQKLQQTQQKCDALSVENKRLINDVHDARDQHTAAGDNIAALQIELKNLKHNYERLKYACTITDNQLTEVEAMLEAEQKRNKIQQEQIDKLHSNLREKSDTISQLKKELHEEQSLKKTAETKIQSLTNEIKEHKSHLQEVQRKLISQQQQLMESTSSLFTAQERADMLTNDTTNLQTINQNFERENSVLKEENARILSDLFHSKEEVQRLQMELKEADANAVELQAEIDELQETLTEKENYYVQRDIKSEATLAQHMKLIDYLQLKVEDFSQKKKKTLADKIFGTATLTSSSSRKENISPNDVEQSILYRTLKEELRREKQKSKTLQEQIDKFNNIPGATAKSPLKTPGTRHNSSVDKQRKSTTMTMTTDIVAGSHSQKLPLKQHGTNKVEKLDIASKQNSSEQVHHRFELALQETNFNASDCAACDKPMIAGSSYWRCKECKASAHRKCRSDVSKPCDGDGRMTSVKPLAPADRSGNQLMDSDANSLGKYSYEAKLDAVVNPEVPLGNSHSADSSYLGTLIYNVAEAEVQLEINCAYDIVEQQILLLGCNSGLYAYHVPQQRLVHIAGIDSVSCIAISPPLAKAIMVGSEGESLYQCDYRQLQSRCQGTTSCNKPALEASVLDLPFANRTVAEKWQLVQISNETENALDSVAIAATSARIVILRYDLKLMKFKPVRALDTATPVSSIFFTRHSAIVSSDKFYEIDLSNYAAEELVDLSDQSLLHTITCQPVVAVRISKQEFLLCFMECGVFTDEFGCRSRPYDLPWGYTPTGFIYREPFLYIAHFQSVQIIRLHRSFSKELAASTVKDSDADVDNDVVDFKRVYLPFYMPTLLSHCGKYNLYTLAIQKHNTKQQIYHLDAPQLFKRNLNESLETLSSVATSITLDSVATMDNS